MTAPTQALLDTDILSAMLRKHPAAIQNARPYLEAHRQLTLHMPCPKIVGGQRFRFCPPYSECSIIYVFLTMPVDFLCAESKI
jgi:hypothetical protein